MGAFDQQRACVTHVSFSRLGGAGAVAARLADGQRRLGWHADLVTQVDIPFPRWAGRHPRIAAAALFDYYVVRRDPRSAFFSLYRRQHAARVARDLAQRPGVLHLHWLPGFLRLPALLARLPASRPIVWSAHDFWPGTGGCHFPHDCAGYADACAGCPQVRRRFQPRVAEAFRRKREGLRARADIRLVAPSEWTRSLLRRSVILRHLPVAVIPNPINTAVFSPGDKAAARVRAGLPSGAFVAGVGAADLRDERKQVVPLLHALRDWMAGRRGAAAPRVLVFGAGRPPPGLPAEFVFVGASSDEARLADWYNAMDVYLSMSRYETFGNTLAEAAACGVPSICRTGSGMSEVVIPGRTGTHVDSMEACMTELAAWASAPFHASRMGGEARRLAVDRFGEEVVAREFLKLYTA